MLANWDTKELKLQYKSINERLLCVIRHIVQQYYIITNKFHFFKS